MNYAWVIDQTRCIGCHACSTACKSENDVPLGVHRTWVKNVEVGTFPNVRRHFAVLRCNHCADPPCVRICPVTAMFQRDDGIVDFDSARCIGCKACMQACPYDAIHITPRSHTAAKCHFCAHRIDQGLLPACVVVCPAEALVFGDLDDPESRVAGIVGSRPVTVRRPEQNTRPKAFYVGAHQATLDPLAAAHEDSYMWAERKTGTAKDHPADFSVWALPGRSNGQRSRRTRMPSARVAYDVHHEITWRGKVSSYLWTKSIAAGTLFMIAVTVLLGRAGSETLARVTAPLVALVALAATGILLIADLKRPERFWYILLKPQWRSWLTRGAYVITAFGALATVWLALGVAGRPAPAWLSWLAVPIATATAVYTAFLFGQCEARDLWQSPLLGIGLFVQMTLAGSAALLIASGFTPTGADHVEFLRVVLLTSLGLHLISVVLGEVLARHGSSNAAAAAHAMTHGVYGNLFWAAMLAGVLAPLVMLTAGGGSVAIGASVLALGGLLAYEHTFVMAAQAAPIS